MKKIYSSEIQRLREKDRRRRERRKADEQARAVRFVCAKCGVEFTIPRGTQVQHAGERFLVRLGGQTVCEHCARSRFRRRHIEWGIHPEAVPERAF